MIQYALKCSNNHRFDSWFQSAEAYEKLLTAGMITCSICGDHTVEKAMMAPRVRPARTTSGTEPAETQDVKESQTSPSLSAPSGPAEQALTELRRKIEETSDYVGNEFAKEARAIHDGDAPSRPIYGEAKPEDAKSLIEDGVPVAPLPFMPGRKTN